MSTERNGHTGNGNANTPGNLVTDRAVSAESDGGSPVSGKIAPQPGHQRTS